MYVSVGGRMRGLIFVAVLLATSASAETPEVEAASSLVPKPPSAPDGKGTGRGLAGKEGDRIKFDLPQGYGLHEEVPLAQPTIPIPVPCKHPCGDKKVWYGPDDPKIVDDINDDTAGAIVGGLNGMTLPQMPALPGEPAPIFKPANTNADVKFDAQRQMLEKAQDQRIAAADRLKRVMSKAVDMADKKVPATLREVVSTINQVKAMRARAMNIFRDAEREIGHKPETQRLRKNQFVSPMSQ